MIFASGATQAVVPPAPRCINVNFNVGFYHEEIDITGMPLETEFDSFVVTNYLGIQCDGSYKDTNPHSAGGFIIVQTPNSPVLAPKDEQMSQVSIADEDGRVGLLSFPTAPNLGYNHVAPGFMPLVLKRKRPGLTVVRLSHIFGTGISNNILTAYNNFSLHLGRESGNIGFGRDELRLIYRPTCSASVNNVDFGNLNVSDINRVTKQAYVDIDCNDLLLAYSIKISSVKGSDNNGIFSENDTVGYRLTWGDLNGTGLEPSLSDKQIELNNELYNRNDPTNTSFRIPINITPVSRLSFGNDIKPGKADSVINIELQFK